MEPAQPRAQRPAVGTRLEPEQPLHLGPDREAEDHEHEDEECERHREAKARGLGRAPPFHTEATLRAVEAVGRTDRI